MNLAKRIRDQRDQDFRAQAALHGVEVSDTPQAARATGLRGFHERMKRRLGGATR